MNNPTSPVTLVPSVLPGDFTADLVHEPLWRQLGADHCRVAVIGLQSQQPLAWRWMRDGGVSSGQGDAQPLDHILPGADALLADWVEHSAAEPGTVITHMLSPRRWVYFWRVDERLGVVVQMHYLTGRSSTHEFDTAGVRVTCEHWLTRELSALQTAARSRAWDQVDRRTRLPVPREVQVALLSLLGCGLFGLWLLVFGAGLVADAASAQQRDIARLAALANNSMQLHLGHAMAGSDYGQVQEVLSLHKSLNHFAAAGVTNARGQVVAHAGFAPALPVGGTVPADIRARSLVMPLTVGSTTLGEVLMVAGPNALTAADATDSTLLWRGLGLLVAALAATGAAMLWRQQYTRRG